MADYNINHTFSNDEGIEYPPPPPPDYPPPYADEAAYSDAPNEGIEYPPPPPPDYPPPYEDDTACSDAPMEPDFSDQQHYDDEFEQTLRDHEHHVLPYQYGGATAGEKRQPLSKRKVFGVLAMVFVVMIVASGIATASKNRQAKQTNIAEINSALVAPTMGPTKSSWNPSTESPVPAPTEAPKSAVQSPTMDPKNAVSPEPNATDPVANATDPIANVTDPVVSVPSDSNQETPSHSTSHHTTDSNHLMDNPIGDTVSSDQKTDPEFPDEFCVDEIAVPKYCYTFGESIEIEYRFCDPGPGDWFGVFRPYSHNHFGRLRSMPFYWEYSCGGHETGCESPSGSGTMILNANLAGGQYMLYSMTGVERPYQSVAGSAVFFVGTNCESYQPQSFTHN